MGQTIDELATADRELEIVARCDAEDSIDAGMRLCDAAIDFSAANAVEEICRLAVIHQRALVIGTTGHTAAQKERIEAAAESIPIVFASNFSVGVNVLFWLSGRTARLLGESFTAEIVET